jgi:hypothetical protein
MKKFFALEHYIDLKFLLFLEVVILLLGLGLTRHMHLNYFSLGASIISIVIYGLSALLDRKTYWNFFTLISVMFFTYGCFWFIFTFMIK